MTTSPTPFSKDDSRLSRRLSREKCVAHCIARAQERYGLEVDAPTLSLIAQWCRMGRAGVLYQESPRRGYRQICEVEMMDILVRVVYCPRHKRIITFLPPREDRARREAMGDNKRRRCRL